MIISEPITVAREGKTLIGQAWVTCLSLDPSGGVGPLKPLWPASKQGWFSQVKPKFCYQRNSEWTLGRQNNRWPPQLDSLLLREHRWFQKNFATAFSHQESHVQKFKGMERRGSLVPVKKIELWLGEVKELRDKDGFVSLPWRYEGEMAQHLSSGSCWLGTVRAANLQDNIPQHN